MAKCCCGYDPTPPPKPKPLPVVNNVRTQNAAFCCGMVEIGNFNYVDPPGGKKMVHYHKTTSGGWQSQPNAEKTTAKDVKARMDVPGAGFIATTGAGQEYMDEVLAEVGFEHVSTFRNPDHADTPVKLWVYRRHKPNAE